MGGDIEDAKKGWELLKKIKKAVKKAKEGKGCACLDTMTAHMCNRMNEYTLAGSPEEIAQCICAPNPDFNCERDVLKHLKPIWDAAKRANELLEK